MSKSTRREFIRSAAAVVGATGIAYVIGTHLQDTDAVKSSGVLSKAYDGFRHRISGVKINRVFTPFRRVKPDGSFTMLSADGREIEEGTAEDLELRKRLKDTKVLLVPNY